MRKVIVTIEEVKATQAFQKAGSLQQNMYCHQYFANAVGNWLTVSRYKGYDHVIGLYHMNETKRKIFTELYNKKMK